MRSESGDRVEVQSAVRSRSTALSGVSVGGGGGGGLSAVLAMLRARLLAEDALIPLKRSV